MSRAIDTEEPTFEFEIFSDYSSGTTSIPWEPTPGFEIDATTGLFGIDYLIYEYEHSRSILGGELDGLALLVVDVDRFGVIESALGKSGADSVLSVVAHRFEDALGGIFPIVRLDFDRFAILGLGVTEVSQVEMLTRTLRSILDSPVVAPDGEEVVVTACVGVVLAIDGSLSGEELIDRAMVAKDRAKARGASKIEYYQENFSAPARDRRAFENIVRRAIDSEELVVLYQPVISLTTGRISGVEALARLRHPERGLISPPEFIPVAKEIGRLSRMGSQVASAALSAMASWRQEYPATPLTLGLNLSGDELDDLELIEELIAKIEEFDLDKAFVFAELGTCDLDPASRCRRSIVRLEEAGISLSADEFGAGASALGLFSAFAVSQVKIDRSLVLGVDQKSRSYGVLSGLVTLAHSLDAEVVGIGVEHAQQIRIMRALGIDRVQGYHIGQPMDRDQIETQLELISR